MSKYQLCKIGLLGIVTFSILYLLVTMTHRQVQEGFNDLSVKTYELNFADEIFIRDRASNASQAKIDQDVNNLRSALSEYVEQLYLIGGNLQPQTFCKIYAYDKWNNSIQDVDWNVSKNKLITQNELYNWKIDLLARINSDSLVHQSFMGTIKDLFSNHSLIKYKRDSCESVLW